MLSVALFVWANFNTKYTPGSVKNVALFNAINIFKLKEHVRPKMRNGKA